MQKIYINEFDGETIYHTTPTFCDNCNAVMDAGTAGLYVADFAPKKKPITTLYCVNCVQNKKNKAIGSVQYEFIVLILPSIKPRSRPYIPIFKGLQSANVGTVWDAANAELGGAIEDKTKIAGRESNELAQTMLNEKLQYEKRMLELDERPPDNIRSLIGEAVQDNCRGCGNLHDKKYLQILNGFLYCRDCYAEIKALYDNEGGLL